MRKNYIYFILLFILSISVSAQKVTLTPATVNNIGYTGGAINLGGVAYSSVSLSVKVELPNNAAVGDTGTIKIYCSNGTALGVNVVVGGDGGSLYFGGGKVATKSFYINLNWSDFSTSFAYLFAEYKNPAGTSYKSSNISIIKNSTLNGGTVNAPADAPNPNKITNTICCNQTIRQGDKPAPITGSQYSNPYFDKIYGINSTWSAFALLQLDNANQVLYLDYYDTPLTSQTIQRRLGYNGTSDFPNKSNIVTITIVPSPITSNKIGVEDQNSINLDGYAEFSNLKSINIRGANTPKVNLNILQNPNHVSQRGDNLVNIDDAQWEYRNVTDPLGKWTPIINDNIYNLYNFNPTAQNSSSDDQYYIVRRIVKYKDISMVSNEVKILSRGLRNNNTICCDQNLKISSLTEYENPQTIIGSTPTLDNLNVDGTNLMITYITYQWQSQTIGRSTSAWSDILGATSKDYLPPASSIKVIQGSGRGTPSFVLESSYNYRRIAKVNYQFLTTKWVSGTISSYSNESSLTGTSSEPSIKLYPNPTPSILNIQSTTDISNSKVTITNIIGNITNQNYSIINPNLISIDVSELTTGTYFITIENGSIFRNTFIKQ